MCAALVDYFCDAAEEIYTLFKGTGATMIGHWPTDGYQHEDSKVLARRARGPLDIGFCCTLVATCRAVWLLLASRVKLPLIT